MNMIFIKIWIKLHIYSAVNFTLLIDVQLKYVLNGYTYLEKSYTRPCWWTCSVLFDWCLLQHSEKSENRQFLYNTEISKWSAGTSCVGTIRENSPILSEKKWELYTSKIANYDNIGWLICWTWFQLSRP